jgi:pilus assembly protein FimV
MRRVAVLAAWLLAAAPAAQGFQLGDLRMQSVAGEPLSADIPVIDRAGVIPERLRIDRAGDAAHARAGIDPATLPPALGLEWAGPTDDVIEVTTDAPVLDQTGDRLAFLVRLRWSDGRLLRRYEIIRDFDGVRVTPSPAARFGPTQRDDTLYSIAERLRPQRLSNNQMMLALLAENPAGFSADNVNALRSDVMLTVPRDGALEFPDESTATDRVLAHGRAWRSGERSAEPAEPAEPTEPAEPAEPAEPPEPPETAETAEPPAAVAAPDASSEAVPAEGTPPMLQLLPPAALVDRSEDAMDISEQVDNAMAPLADQLDRLESSNASLRAQNESLQRTLTELRDDVAGLEARLFEALNSASQPDTSAQDVTGVMIQDWLVSRIDAVVDDPRGALRTPWAQWTLAVLALLLIAVLLWIRRRRRRRTAADAAMPSDWTPAADRVAPAGAAAEPTLGEPHVQSNDALADDPLKLADERIAHGRLESAQALLDEALGEEPDSVDLRIRLLDVLAMREDRAGFRAEAHVLQAQLNDPEDARWQRVAAKGRMLSPGHPLFQQ